MDRYNRQFIEKDIVKKMVFIGGPRQVGKTTLCNIIGNSQYINKFQYLNWDIDEDRKIILDKSWLQTNNKLIIFDELHKYNTWKQWIKGVYDSDIEYKIKYLVTGSARLDTYKKGGDSLLGRYHYWRLHPLTIDELPNNITATEGLDRLLELGGFPEPFLLADHREARRWRNERFNRIIQEDIRDLEYIKNIQLLKIFVDSLRERAGQLITLSNIARDLQISPITARSWLESIERMYIAFAIYPLSKNVPRSLNKPPKVYFFDNADLIESNQFNKGAKLENLVATTLLKRLHFVEDYHGYACRLHYLRDRDGREVDFVTIVDDKIKELIEVKNSDEKISSSLKYFKKILNPETTIQLTYNLLKPYEKDGIKVMNIIEYFSSPPWQ